MRLAALVLLGSLTLPLSLSAQESQEQPASDSVGAGTERRKLESRRDHGENSRPHESSIALVAAGVSACFGCDPGAGGFASKHDNVLAWEHIEGLHPG